MTLYTGPERATERQMAKRTMAKILKAGGCAVCKHAVHGFDLVVCDRMGRVFPRCMSTPGLSFELDQQKLDKINAGEDTCVELATSKRA